MLPSISAGSKEEDLSKWPAIQGEAKITISIASTAETVVTMKQNPRTLPARCLLVDRYSATYLVKAGPVNWEMKPTETSVLTTIAYWPNVERPSIFATTIVATKVLPWLIAAASAF